MHDSIDVLKYFLIIQVVLGFLPEKSEFNTGVILNEIFGLSHIQ